MLTCSAWWREVWRAFLAAAAASPAFCFISSTSIVISILSSPLSLEARALLFHDRPAISSLRLWCRRPAWLQTLSGAPCPNCGSFPAPLQLPNLVSTEHRRPPSSTHRLCKNIEPSLVAGLDCRIGDKCLPMGEQFDSSGAVEAKAVLTASPGALSASYDITAIDTTHILALEGIHQITPHSHSFLNNNSKFRHSILAITCIHFQSTRKWNSSRTPMLKDSCSHS